jgi:hypothetical protein
VVQLCHAIMHDSWVGHGRHCTCSRAGSLILLKLNGGSNCFLVDTRLPPTPAAGMKGDKWEGKGCVLWGSDNWAMCATCYAVNTQYCRASSIVQQQVFFSERFKSC